VQKTLAAALVVAVALIPTAARAQMGTAQPTEGVRFGVGAGLTLPMGDYGDLDKMGFHALGLVQLPLKNTPIHLRGDVMFSQTSHKSGFTSGNSRLIGVNVDALYHLGRPAMSFRPYVLGGIGYYNGHESVTSTSQSKIAFNLGGGALFGLGSMNAFVEARYVSISTSGGSTTFIPLTFGIMLGSH
jgi:hypothetical protein